MDLLGGQRGRQRQVAAGDPLREAHQVGRDPLVLAGEHAPGAPEADRHLVADEQRAVAVAQLADRAQVALGVHDHPGRALDQRLHDHGRDLAGVRLEQPLHVRGVARLGLERVEQQRAVHRVEQVDAADRHRADRVPVVGVAQRDEAGALGLAALLPVLERHLQRDLGGGGAAVGVEAAGEPGRRERGEALGELDGGGVGEPEHRGVRHAVELVADGGVDRGMAVPVDRAPQRRDAVDVAPALGVDQLAALGALHDQRVLLRPSALLGEGVPDVLAVERCEPLRVDLHDERP